MTEREISFHLSGDDQFKNPVWAVRDTHVPTVGDTVTIENADETIDRYEVVARAWVTAKQGASSFTHVRLIVQQVVEPWLATR